MPMSRYEIKNEYSLADPELYQTADKDDPEALLEGVAMAGLVGLLRQLGDLAEFAAEIFHNLHEEVVATAARGHGLMIRVQQLEAEVPSLEKAFLSQTDHSSFLYHSGVDWHPHIRMDQNLVTQGDLPRFIMDSYEECREPPRLFLLDKFDVAGAGACLKRYTDPSFYKVESTDISSANMQREKKILKEKRKGPRWKNGEVPEASPVSHSKLHQLFLEERVENGVSNSSSRVKLKRRLNGYPFDTKTGTSYMEKLLRSSSPDHEELYEVTKDPAPSILMTNEQDEPKSEFTEGKQSSPGTLSVRRKRSTSSSTVSEKIMKPNDIPVDDIISRSPNLYPSTEADENSSARDNGSSDRVIGMDVESKRVDLLGYQSDDISSEIDYVDAPSTVMTEMDTDSEMRVKGVSTSAYSNKQPLASDVNEENLYPRSDSQSIGDSISDAGSSSSKKDMLNHSSDSSNNPAESSIYDETSLEKIPCVGIPENEVVDSLFDQKNGDEHFSIQQYSETMVPEGSCTRLDDVTIHKSEFEQLNYSMSSSDSPPTVTHSDSSDIVRKDSSSKRQLHGTVSNDDDEVKKTILITDPHHSSVSDSDSQKGNECPGPSAGEHSVSESDCNNMHVSLASEHFPGMIFSENQQPGEVDRDFFELPENLTAKYADMAQNGDNFEPWVSSKEDIKDETANGSLNVCTPTENELPSIVEASIDRKLGETSLYIDQISHIEDNQTNDFVDSQISSTQSNSWHPLDSPDWGGAKSSGHGEYANPEENVTKYETVVSPSSSSSEVLGLDDSCMKNDVPHSDSATLRDMWYPEKLQETVENSCNTSEKLEDSADNLFSATEKIEEHAENICSPPEKLEEAAQSSCLSPEELEEPTKNFQYALENSEDLAEKLYSTSEKFEDPARMLYNGETDGIILCASPSEQEIDEVAADLKSLNEAHVLGESDEEQHKTTSEELASSIPATSDDHCTLDDYSLRLSSNEVDVDDTLYSEDSRFDDPENDKNVLPGNQLELGFMEKADETKADTSVHDAVFVNSINHDYHQPEIADGNNPNSHLNSETDNSLEVSHSTKSQSLPENDRVDQEFLDEGGILNCDFDAPLHSNHEREQSMLPHKADLLPDKLAQELSESDEVRSFPVNREQITDHYSHRGFSEEIILQAKDNLPSDHHGEELQNSSTRSPITHQEMLELNDRQGASDSSSSFSPINHTNQFSSELTMPFNLPFFPNNPFAPNFPPPDPFTGTDQVNLTDLPPLPPLPPVQWRLGKLQQSLSATDLSMSPRDVSSREISKSIDDLSTFNVSTKESFIHMIPETREENAENSMLVKEAGTVHQTADVTLKTETENKQLQFVPNDTSIPVVHNYSHEAIEFPPKIENESSPNTEASATAEDRVTAAEVVLTQSPLSMINTPHETVVDTQPKIENQKIQLEKETTSPSDDSGVGNSVRSLKARLPSPLVDDASVLDKSKLRKVTERVRPELKKVDERDSFLQQIKTRSFNLKPAVPSRRSIRGPSTNLKVAAILEKANAIRQALAGSDEDEDSWSDS